MRGQAAIEFITTYGWAFMILLVMIGAISYLGITNPSVFIPEKCSLGSDLLCNDFMISDSGVIIMNLKQNYGETKYISSMECEYDGNTAEGYFHDSSWSLSGDELLRTDYKISELFNQKDPASKWQPQDSKMVKCVFSPNPFSGLDDQMVNVHITLKLTKSWDGFTHRIDGDINAKVTS